MGFQHMPKVVREAAQRKGGKWKVKKGFGTNPDLARKAGAKGGKAKAANRSNRENIQKENSQSKDEYILERVLDLLKDE